MGRMWSYTARVFLGIFFYLLRIDARFKLLVVVIVSPSLLGEQLLLCSIQVD